MTCPSTLTITSIRLALTRFLISFSLGIKRHSQVILCTVSPYFRRLLTSLPQAAAAHPVLLMPRDVTQAEVGQILDYIYYGEVSLPQSQVQRFLDIAEHFEIRGLKEDPQLGSEANRQSPSPQNLPKPSATAGRGAKLRHPSSTMRSVGLVCPQCNQICQNVADLKTHIAETHSRPRSRLPCTICDQNFKTSAALEAHLNSHYTTDNRPVGSVAPQQQQSQRGSHQGRTPSNYQQQQLPKIGQGQQQQARRPSTSPLTQEVKKERKGRLSGNKYDAVYQPEEPSAKKAKTGDIASTLSQRFGGGISVSSVSSGQPRSGEDIKEVKVEEEEEGDMEQYHQEGEEDGHHLPEDAVNDEEEGYEGYYEEEGDDYEEGEYPSYDNYGHA